MTHVTVVIMARAHRGRVEIIKSIRLSCEWKVKGSDSKCTHKVRTLSSSLILTLFSTEADKNDSPLVPRHHFCNKDGFNITIPHNATVPPLNLDVIWIPSGQGHGCKAQKRSKDAVTFSFPFTDCGTQSMVNVNKLHQIIRWYFCVQI